MDWPSPGRTSRATCEAPPSLSPAGRHHPVVLAREAPLHAAAETAANVERGLGAGAAPFGRETLQRGDGALHREGRDVRAGGRRGRDGAGSRGREQERRASGPRRGGRPPRGPRGRSRGRGRRRVRPGGRRAAPGRGRGGRRRGCRPGAVEDLRGDRPEPWHGGEDRVDAGLRVREAEGPLGVGLQDPHDGSRRARESADHERDSREGDAVGAEDPGEGRGRSGTVGRRAHHRCGE